jgi:hypothetical protein
MVLLALLVLAAVLDGLRASNGALHVMIEAAEDVLVHREMYCT